MAQAGAKAACGDSDSGSSSGAVAAAVFASHDVCAALLAQLQEPRAVALAACVSRAMAAAARGRWEPLRAALLPENVPSRAAPAAAALRAYATAARDTDTCFTASATLVPFSLDDCAVVVLLRDAADGAPLYAAAFPPTRDLAWSWHEGPTNSYMTERVHGLRGEAPNACDGAHAAAALSRATLSVFVEHADDAGRVQVACMAAHVAPDLQLLRAADWRHRSPSPPPAPAHDWEDGADLWSRVGERRRGDELLKQLWARMQPCAYPNHAGRASEHFAVMRLYLENAGGAACGHSAAQRIAHADVALGSFKMFLLGAACPLPASAQAAYDAAAAEGRREAWLWAIEAAQHSVPRELVGRRGLMEHSVRGLLQRRAWHAV